MSAPKQPYATCNDCGVDLADRDGVSAHGRDTMTPTGESGIVARGHRITIVSPTEAEQRASRARMVISDALDEAYEYMSDRIDRDEVTLTEIAENLWVFDLADGWADYMEEESE